MNSDLTDTLQLTIRNGGLVTLVLLSLLGCSSSHAGCPSLPPRCVPVLRIDLHDPSGNRVPGSRVTVNGASDGGVSANPCSASDSCSISVNAPDGDLFVSATGYEPVIVHYTSENDACGYPVDQRIDITVVPEGSSMAPTQTQSLGTSCGG